MKNVSALKLIAKSLHIRTLHYQIRMFGIHTEKKDTDSMNVERLLKPEHDGAADGNLDSNLLSGDISRPLPPQSESSNSIGPALSLRRKKVYPNDSDDNFVAVYTPNESISYQGFEGMALEVDQKGHIIHKLGQFPSSI